MPQKSADLSRADSLYESAKAHYEILKRGDNSVAALIIEEANDALELYGETSQSRKVELREMVARAQEALPPASAKEIIERVTATILRVIWPRNRFARNAVILIIVVGVVLFGVPTLRSMVTQTSKTEFDRYGCSMVIPSNRHASLQASTYARKGDAAFVAGTRTKKWSDLDLHMREALAQYEVAASLDECSALYQVDVGTVLIRLGNYDEALPYLTRGVQLDPSNAWFQNELCVALKKLKRYGDSVAPCALAIKRDVRNASFDENTLLKDLSAGEKYRKAKGLEPSQ